MQKILLLESHCPLGMISESDWIGSSMVIKQLLLPVLFPKKSCPTTTNQNTKPHLAAMCKCYDLPEHGHLVFKGVKILIPENAEYRVDHHHLPATCARTMCKVHAIKGARILLTSLFCAQIVKFRVGLR
jgi:hypothetical protein